jgi:hypothetical protein
MSSCELYVEATYTSKYVVTKCPLCHHQRIGTQVLIVGEGYFYDFTKCTVLNNVNGHVLYDVTACNFMTSPGNASARACRCCKLPHAGMCTQGVDLWTSCKKRKYYFFNKKTKHCDRTATITGPVLQMFVKLSSKHVR